MHEHPPYPGAPRWVKLSAIAAAVLILLLFSVTMLDGDHGARRHPHASGSPP